MLQAIPSRVVSRRIWLIGNYEPDRQKSMQRFASLLLDQLKMAGELEVNLVRPEPVFGRIAPSPVGLGKWLGYLDKFVVFPRRLRRLAGAAGPGAIFHICDHSNSSYTRPLADRAHLVTCHDLLAVRSALGEIPQNPVRWTGRRLQAMIRSGLSAARWVACVSEATQRDLQRICGLGRERSRVIPNGLNYPYAPWGAAKCDQHLQPLFRTPGSSFDPGRFLLHVGGNQWYKNRAGVVDIYAALKRRWPEAPGLVMAGHSFDDALRAKVAALPVRECIRELVDPASETLQALYSRAEALLFPSLEEGFGWPIIEAQASGCPVVTTDKAPMTEVGGDAAIYIDPAQFETSARRVEELLRGDPADLDRRRRAGIERARLFSPQIMVEAYREMYGMILGENAEMVKS